ncbi:MAG: leucyl aminopeptidase family protein [Woeseiaceae bacterium]|nr:leucyl aminopeptidase family protein [Woeseiaceae bacterium]
MHPLLYDQRDIRVAQRPGRVTARSLEAVDQLLLILPERVRTELWRSLPGGAKLAAAAKRRAASEVPTLVSRLDNKRQTLVVGGQIAATASAHERLEFGRKLVAAATTEKAGALAICVLGFDDDASATIARDVLSAALAAAFTLPAYKAKPAKPTIRRVSLIGLSEKIDVSRATAEASGNNLARWLTAMPPNKLDAVNYAEIVKDLASDHGWQFKRFGTRALQKLGAGAFLAVAQGNQNDSASIVRLRYRPGASDAKPDLSLVGKGIIFDTGGTNLKPFEYMLDMHGDMQGSAVALGTFLSITKMKLPLAVDCWLAITENRTGPEAYKSQDVVTAANGKTIQTIHTDAEGRMALADTLVFACQEEPSLVLDYATLTGACINAITTRYSGVFTNRPDWHPRLKRTGQRCGERVWPFPIGKEFLEVLKSETADIMQCAVKNPGDHILAGSFLSEFIENDIPWVHMDLSSGDHEGGLGHVPTKVTGFGVRYTMSLLLDEDILGSSTE